MIRSVALCALCVFVLASSASAQIIYEPVQYQYSAGGTTYYYGGADPLVHHYAAQPYSSGGTWGRVNGWAFVSGDTRVSREVAAEPVRTFTDSMRFNNAHLRGFTPDDARNEAYANMPRYFRKRELLNAAVRDLDGTWVVPAQAQPVRIYKSNGTRIESAPTTMPRPLMIIPKDALKQNKPGSMQARAD